MCGGEPLRDWHSWYTVRVLFTSFTTCSLKSWPPRGVFHCVFSLSLFIRGSAISFKMSIYLFIIRYRQAYCCPKHFGSLCVPACRGCSDCCIACSVVENQSRVGRSSSQHFRHPSSMQDLCRPRKILDTTVLPV